MNQRLDFKTKPNKAISKPLSPLDSHHPTKQTQWEAVILLKTVQASHNQPTLQGSHEGALSGERTLVSLGQSEGEQGRQQVG